MAYFATKVCELFLSLYWWYLELNECDSNPCWYTDLAVDENGDRIADELYDPLLKGGPSSVCNDATGSYSCDCTSGTTGVNCETSKYSQIKWNQSTVISHCTTDLCNTVDVNATCEVYLNSFICNCSEEYTKTYCDLGRWLVPFQFKNDLISEKEVADLVDIYIDVLGVTVCFPLLFLKRFAVLVSWRLDH